MKALATYSEKITKAYSIAERELGNTDFIKTLSENKEALLKTLQENSYVKVPFVGDFSAGKSSMINALLNLGDYLPTDITPETAVAYELWYSKGECLELWRESKLQDTYDLSRVSELTVRPGDLVKVFIDNEKVKELNDRGIVIVDMPGIDSGIEAHTSAILNYIHQGTAFVVFTDIEQGTLRGSTISFIEELKKYGINTAIFISKADKKPEEEQAKVLETVTAIAKRVLGENVYVGLASAHQGLFNDLETWLSGLSAEEMVVQKFDKSVSKFIQSVGEELALSLGVLQKGDLNYEDRIQEIAQSKEKKLAELNRNASQSQPLEESVNDIIRDIDYALKSSASKLAAILCGGDAESLDLKAEIMNIIRPAIITGYGRELKEYSDYLDDGIRNFSVDLESILDVIHEDFDWGKDIVDDILTTLLPLFDIPAPLARMIAHKVSEYVPEVLRRFFGKSSSEMISEIKAKLINDVFPQIILELRPPITEAVQKGRQDALRRAEEQIEMETKRFDEALALMKEEMEKDVQSREEKSARFESALEDIRNLL